MTPGAQTLLLLRHATAERGPAGGRDADRRLTEGGRVEAAGVGDHLRSRGLRVGHVLCSPALRTRETLEQLRLGAGPVVELEPLLYQADGTTLVELVALAAATGAGTVLLVGHAPGVPSAVDLLAGPGSAPAAAAALASAFAPATLAELRVAEPSVGPGTASLVGVRVPHGREGRHFG